ncbi:MAG TPA: CrcB family protein [Solirubrobacteraceae bacterium]|nr:CrcB family protein [Solirubrobacteraceae bacterium]
MAAAGAAGVVSRYGLSTWIGSAPWAIVGINVLGSFLLGLLAGLGASDDVRTVLGVGFLGGFTTFSTFSLDVWSDLEAGRTGRALAVVGLSVVLGVAAAGVGWAAGRA